MAGEGAQRLLGKGFEDVPDATLDDIARLATRVCGTPMAAVTLFDVGRRRCAVTNSLAGPRLSGDDLIALAIDAPFFAPDAVSGAPIVVVDTRADSRWAEHPLVAGPPGVRFYAGVPLVSESGATVGAVCVLDTEPRRLSSDDLDALRSLAGQVVGQLELRYEAARARKLLERLARDEQRLIDAQRLAAVGSWEWDAATGEVAWSEEMYRLFDWPTGTAVDDPEGFVARIGSAEAELLWATIGQAWQQGGEFELEIRVDPAGGQPKRLAWRGQVIVGVEGRRTGLRGTARDVTKQRAAEQELRLQGIIVANMAEGVAIYRAADETIVYANPTFAKLFGYEAGELEGTSVSMLNAPDERRRPAEAAAEMIDALRRTGSWSGEVHSLRRDGSTLWCQARLSTFDHPDYGPVWIAVHTDISERKRAEAERDKFAAAQALFIAAAAHELRTPVTTLVGMASTLQQHRHAMTPDELDFAFGALGRQGERMSGLIGHLLDLARIDNSGDLASMKVIALDDVVVEALETAPPPADVRVRTSIAPDLQVRVEPVGLSQVVVNLLTNAYRYGGPLIEIEAVAHHEGVTITVADDGPGVAPDLIDRLFQPFTRGAGGAVRGGSGLGLTVTERTLEAFGGSIRYEPGRPSGSRFVIDLPAPE